MRVRRGRLVGLVGSAVFHMGGAALAVYPEWFGLPRWELRIPQGKNSPLLAASMPQPRREAAESVQSPPTKIESIGRPPQRREATPPERPVSEFAVASIDQRVPLPEEKPDTAATVEKPAPQPTIEAAPPKVKTVARRTPRDLTEQIESPASAPSEASSGSEAATPPEIVRQVKPMYPAQAQAAGQQGTVKLYVRVDEGGNVLDAAVARSSGFPLLDDAALETIYRWRFARVGGRRNVATEFLQPIVFTLGR